MSSILEGTQPKINDRKDNMKLSIINFQSIKNKVPEFEIFTTTCHPHVIIGTETWLTPSIGNSEIFPEDCIVFCKDRVGKTGGVLIAAIRTMSVQK